MTQTQIAIIARLVLGAFMLGLWLGCVVTKHRDTWPTPALVIGVPLIVSAVVGWLR